MSSTGRRQGVVVALGVALLLAVGLAGANDTAASRCIRSAPEARYRGMGYNHIVHVTNVCKVAAECDVSTDVNPQPVHVSVAAGEQVEVTTFIGSPAREFTPKVDCVMQSR
jgi:hypothetical protein